METNYVDKQGWRGEAPNGSPENPYEARLGVPIVGALAEMVEMAKETREKTHFAIGAVKFSVDMPKHLGEVEYRQDHQKKDADLIARAITDYSQDPLFEVIVKQIEKKSE